MDLEQKLQEFEEIAKHWQPLDNQCEKALAECLRMLEACMEQRDFLASAYFMDADIRVPGLEELDAELLAAAGGENEENVKI